VYTPMNEPSPMNDDVNTSTRFDELVTSVA
jgi:hypothetical protein